MSRRETLGSRGDMLVEALTALRLLRAERMQVEPLAEQLGCGRRTTYRLLATLRRAGVEVQAEHEGPRVYYRVTRAALERAMGLT